MHLRGRPHWPLLSGMTRHEPGACVMTLCILPAIWLALLLFPPVISGPRSYHWLLWIRLNRAPGWRHVLVHERGEFRLAKLAGLATGVVFVALPASPILWVLQPLAMAFADQGVRASGAVDYAGHEAEILSAERAGETGYRAAEIARMSDDRDKQGDDIAAELARWRWLARIVGVLGK